MHNCVIIGVTVMEGGGGGGGGSTFSSDGSY